MAGPSPKSIWPGTSPLPPPACAPVANSPLSSPLAQPCAPSPFRSGCSSAPPPPPTSPPTKPASCASSPSAPPTRASWPNGLSSRELSASTRITQRQDMIAISDTDRHLLICAWCLVCLACLNLLRVCLSILFEHYSCLRKGGGQHRGGHNQKC